MIGVFVTVVVGLLIAVYLLMKADQKVKEHQNFIRIDAFIVFLCVFELLNLYIEITTHVCV